MSKRVTTQGLYALFRKAGIPAAKWEASGMVRGWGEWSSGVKLSKEFDAVLVGYRVGNFTKIGPQIWQHLREVLSVGGFHFLWSEEFQELLVPLNQPEATP